MNQSDTSIQKQVNITCSSQKYDMDFCPSRSNDSLNSLDDTRNILKTSPDNREDIISVQDERSVTKEPSMFNYEIFSCSGTSTLPAAPPFMQMTQDSINNNNNIRMTKENTPLAFVKKKLLPLLMTGKERTADKQRRGPTRELEMLEDLTKYMNVGLLKKRKTKSKNQCQKNKYCR